MAVQSVQTCQWSTPTIFLPWPLWYDAAAFEWSCTRGARPRGVEDPATCAACAGWTAAARHVPCGCHQDDHLGSVAP